MRLWIELLKNTYYIDNTDEMQILPNIDINIKCGNSLTSNINFEVGKSIPSSLGKKITEEVNKYKQLVKEYKNSESKINKDDINRKIHAIYNNLELGCTLQLQLLSDDVIRKSLEEAGKISKAKFDAMQGALEWAISFPEVLDENGIFEGFDLIIGNPPYGVTLTELEKKYYKNKYKSAKSIPHKQKGSLDTYTLFIERGIQLAKPNANLFYIVPMAITSSDSCVLIQDLMENKCNKIKISSYSNRPTQIFDSAGLRVSIVELYQINNKIKCVEIENTKLQRKRKSDNPDELLAKLKFINSKKYKLKGRYAKISENIDRNILEKIFSNKTLETFCEEKDGLPIYYRTTGGRYFNVITNHSTGSSKEKDIFLNSKYASAIGCILSSTLFWYYIQIYSNGLDLKDYEIKTFPIPNLTDNDIQKLESIYELYLEDINKNAITHEAKSYNVSTFKEFKIVKSFNYVQQIDDIVCKLYGLTDEETNYIKNYEIEYRLRDVE